MHYSLMGKLDCPLYTMIYYIEVSLLPVSE